MGRFAPDQIGLSITHILHAHWVVQSRMELAIRQAGGAERVFICNQLFIIPLPAARRAMAAAPPLLRMKQR